MKRDWDIRTDEPLVSVCTITYSHAPYIRQCLDSILSQKTDFPFELIVHDDASTDGTTEILREYSEKYPQIIVVIFQTENQHSKGIKASPTYVWPRARGKYIALCEGDDFWIDSTKLQQQVDYLEAHPSKGMVHSAYILQDDNTDVSRERHLNLNHDDEALHWRIIAQELMVCTCSVMCRAEEFLRLRVDFSADFDGFSMGDTQTWFHFARLYGIGYIDTPLGVYRKSSAGMTASADPIKRIHFLEEARRLDLYLAEKYEAPLCWVEKIRMAFARSLLIEAFVTRDTHRVHQYSAELLRKNRLSAFLIGIVVRLWLGDRRVIQKTIRILGADR